MVMATSWGWRSRRRGASGPSPISWRLLLMQLTSLLLLLSSGLGPKIQSGDGGGKSRKGDPGYFGVFPESKPSVPIRKSSIPILCHISTSGC